MGATICTEVVHMRCAECGLETERLEEVAVTVLQVGGQVKVPGGGVNSRALVARGW